MIKIDEAISILLEDVKPTQAVETVELLDAHRRVLAADQHSTIDVPPANVSAMDGYAVRLKDVSENSAIRISQRIPAGTSPKVLEAKTAARLFTGSEIPEGADTVIIQENCEASDQEVTFLTLPTPGANVRERGQDIQANANLLNAGRLLQAQDLGLLASVGISQIPCFKPLKIGVLSTGDELVGPSEALGPGKIYNSNRFTLKGLVSSLNMEFVSLGHVEDTLEATIKALKNASEKADLIISTGGVSVGEEDHIKDAVVHLGQLNLWKLSIKPGKPLAYGHIKTNSNTPVPFFGLPGNPVAVFVTFLMIVRPYLLKMQGQKTDPIQALQMPCNFSIDKKSPRQEYRRVRIEGNTVNEFHSQDSGVLSSTHWANALAVIPAETCIAKNDLVDVYPFQFFDL